ncbi:hypothetical protein BKA57DRAFT_320328, partial [Linnemannia elongata]
PFLHFLLLFLPFSHHPFSLLIHFTPSSYIHIPSLFPFFFLNHTLTFHHHQPTSFIMASEIPLPNTPPTSKASIL